MLYKFPQHYRLSMTYSVMPALASWTATAYCSISVLILNPGRDCVRHSLQQWVLLLPASTRPTLSSLMLLYCLKIFTRYLIEAVLKISFDKKNFMRKNYVNPATFVLEIQKYFPWCIICFASAVKSQIIIFCLCGYFDYFLTCIATDCKPWCTSRHSSGEDTNHGKCSIKTIRCIIIHYSYSRKLLV